MIFDEEATAAPSKSAVSLDRKTCRPVTANLLLPMVNSLLNQTHRGLYTCIDLLTEYTELKYLCECCMV